MRMALKSRNGAAGAAASREALMRLAEARIAIEGIDPMIDGGRFAAKAVAGWPMTIEADIFSDGHEVIRAAVLTGRAGAEPAAETEMDYIVNDRWTADVTFPEPGAQVFSFVAWRDPFGSWRRDTAKKIAAGQDVSVEAEEGRAIVAEAEASGADRSALKALQKALAKAPDIDALMAPETQALMHRAGPRADVTRYPASLPVWVDRERAAFGAWYELFPRSTRADGTHGTFRDVIERLPYVRDLGFDVLYFTPIHPIGAKNRKGKNNSLVTVEGDVGSPYAIGSAEGGHTAVHPALGTLDDFAALVQAAKTHDLEIAIDVALNASPDHPWIAEHPDWFERRPDGTIKYAENPPKKYEDIVNFRYFLADGSPNAPYWEGIRDMFLFWAEHGVLAFRVDNPHTKPFPFWEWIIAEVRAKHPGAIFLAEAFTRPKVMKRLAKVGYNQSYSYFTWRTTKAELTEYLHELTTEDCRHVMRPNFFVNTPDINPFFLQSSGRPGFRTRAILAASLGGNYGVYSGYELCEAAPLPGKEEYLDSEKYEIRVRDYDAEGHIKDDLRLINALRREQPALRHFTDLKFYNAWNPSVLYYGKMDARSGNYLLFHVNLDPQATQEFGFEVPLWEFDLPDAASIEVQDLIHKNHFTWHGKEQRLTLDPQTRPYAIWRLLPPGGPRA